MPDMQPEDLLQHILVANATYAEAFSQSDPVLLARLAKGQSPRICWLGCSDSRVSAELSTGVAPGSIFVHRNVAQCFHPGDLSALAALSYAVHVLKVEAIIVCGHTGCGGVKAAMMAATDEVVHGSPLPNKTEIDRIISEWIAPIKAIALDQLATAASSVSGSSDAHPHTTYDPLSAHSLAMLTDKHVADTVKAVSESQIVRDAWAQGMELSVHGWVYHVATAKLRDLGIGVRGVGIPAFTLGSRPSSYAGSEPPTYDDGESDDEESAVSSLEEQLDAKLSI